jgi:hypothetical protein
MRINPYMTMTYDIATRCTTCTNIAGAVREGAWCTKQNVICPSSIRRQSLADMPNIRHIRWLE